MTKPVVTSITQKSIFNIWFPLAAMWVIMGIELPVVNALIARMPEALENLAAFGITFSICLLIESPIIQLLTAATALVKGPKSYRSLVNFMHISALILTLIHLFLGVTPLYEFILRRWMNLPERLIPLSRTSFLILTPWAASIGYRRLWQGVLIGFKRTKVVPLTMVVRILVTFLVIAAGYGIQGISGSVLGGISLSVGVVAGAAAAFFFTAPVRKKDFLTPSSQDGVIPWKRMLKFYIPLASTSFINLAARALVALGIARAALPVESLAIWSVISSFIFLFQAVTMCYQEVAIALLSGPGEHRELWRFILRLSILAGAALLIVSLTPAGDYLLGKVTGLEESLIPLTRIPMYILSSVPLTIGLVSWYRAVQIRRGNTMIVTKGVVINSIGLTVLLFSGAALIPWTGITLASIAYAGGVVLETIYLYFVTRKLFPVSI